MPQIIPNIKDDLLLVLLLSCFVEHPERYKLIYVKSTGQSTEFAGVLHQFIPP